MKNRTKARIIQVLRRIHPVFGIALGVFLYSPLSGDPAFAAAVKYGAFPALALSGLVIWWLSRPRSKA